LTTVNLQCDVEKTECQQKSLPRTSKLMVAI